MTRHAEVIMIPETEVKKMQDFLNSKGKDKVGTIETYTVKFEDATEGDIQIDVKVCQGNPPFVDIVLFQDGNDVGCLEPADSLLGRYVFQDVLENVYEVSVIAAAEMARCSCGHGEFYAHQLCRMDIVCDGGGNWIRNTPSDDSSCYDAENPYGPFTCTKCRKEYEELVSSEWWHMKTGQKVDFLVEQRVSTAVALVWIANESQHRMELQPYIDIMDHLNS